MCRSSFFVRIGLISVFASLLIPSLVAEDMPVPDSAVEAGLRDYLSKCDRANAIVKSELAPTYGYSDEDILGLPHIFFRDCYYYWEGTYGQLVRETVSIVFRKVDADRWTLNDYQHSKSDTKIVKDPTKPLPAIPERPTKDELTTEIKNYIAENYSLYDSITVTKLDLGEPKFEWYGIDYQWGGYQYSGKITFTWKSKKRGSGLGSLLASAMKETKQCDSVFNMLYSIADRAWHSEFSRMNLIDD